MTQLLDTSVLHSYARSDNVRKVVDTLVSAGALLTTCPVAVAEYCFSAESPEMLAELQEGMALLCSLE